MSLFYFNEEHQAVRETARRFTEKEITPFIDEWEESGGIPRELFLKAGEAGLLGMGYDEQYGGTPGDIFHAIAINEELMRAGSGGVVAGLQSLNIGLPPVHRWGSDTLKARIIPEVLAGSKIACLAITEPGAGSDVAGLRTRAEQVTVDGKPFYKVNGSKMFITSGVIADYYTVAVRTGGEGFGGISLLLIEKDIKGFSVGKNLKKMGWWASDTAELFFDDCLVPAENLIGQENQGFYCIMSNFQPERISLAVMANTTSEVALNACLEYVKDRSTFGKTLKDHQIIRHKLAVMASKLEASREFTYRIAARYQAGEDVSMEVSMAKNIATDTSDHITYQATQIFGGMGFMRESVVERLYRDNRILAIGGGTYEIMNEVIAKNLGL
ncbi:acyl-CoA dehydrogenase family protein [Endozoicomonas arenosclerae]|uniref:acyl-CoA dehydrogenase family protein n=1 Tax=Endozoicomonas arenosclerae TaxID=1633495 RepID=UPI000AD25278